MSSRMTGALPPDPTRPDPIVTGPEGDVAAAPPPGATIADPIVPGGGHDPEANARARAAAQDSDPYVGPTTFTSFEDFYPYYLSRNQHPTNQRLRLAGTAFVALALVMVVLDGLIDAAGWLVMAPIVSFGLAWIGHHFFERNQPTSLSHPLWTFMADCRVAWDTLKGRKPW
jgi:hypothetical protein